MTERRPPEQDSDYDGAWKEALRAHLPEFVEKYFPAVHATIDWTVHPHWYDKELSQVLGQPGHRNRTVDVLVKVRLRSGAEQWVLVHLEIQTAREAGFAERIALYNSGLFWVFRQRVVTLVVLADLSPDWRPTEDVFELDGFRSRLEFPICKLIERLQADWQEDDSLPVLVARAQVEALRTAGDSEDRYHAKWKLVRRLYEMGYNADQVRELFRLIDWMMHLRQDLEERFRVDLDELEEELSMPYVTSVERLAKAEGIAEGIAEGKAEGKAEGVTEGKASVILSVLRRGCGQLPAELEARIAGLPLGELDQLQERMLDFQNPAEVDSWLDGLSQNEAE